jgi:hypothetical protein
MVTFNAVEELSVSGLLVDRTAYLCIDIYLFTYIHACISLP